VPFERRTYLLVVETEGKRVDRELPSGEPAVERLEACGPRGLAFTGNLSEAEPQNVDAPGPLRRGNVDEYLGRRRVTVPVTVAAPVLGMTLPTGSIVRRISSRGWGGTFGSNANGAAAAWLKSARFATPRRQAPGATAQSTGPLAGVSMRRSTVKSVVNAPLASD
jgi:hypothetical protein